MTANTLYQTGHIKRLGDKKGMKKLLMMVALAAMPALAAEKTVSGDVTYTNASEFNSSTEYYIKAGASDKTVTFGSSYRTKYLQVYYSGTTQMPITFEATDKSYGIGTLTGDFVIGGDNGSCHLTINNGTYSTGSGKLLVGWYNGSGSARTGYLVMKGGSMAIGAETRLGGYGNGSTGTMVIDGGTFSCGNLKLGYGGSDKGYLYVSNGVVSVYGVLLVGNGNDSTGYVEICEGGTLNAYSESFTIPAASGATGSIMMKGGTLDTRSRNITLGNGSSPGYFCISNGTANVNAFLLGGSSGNADTLEVSGGSLNVGDTRLGTVSGVTGNLVINGGEMTASDGNYVRLGHVSGATGNLELNGGVLKVYEPLASSGTGTIAFNGGILAPMDTSAMTFNLANITSTIADGGMMVSNDYTVTIKMTGFSAGDGVVSPKITKKGSGELILSGFNSVSFSPTITVEDGTLVVETTRTDWYTLGAFTKVEQDGTTYTFSPSAIAEEGVTIPSDWIEEYDLAALATAQGTTVEALLASDSAVTAENGYNYFVCYALGLDPTDETSTPKIAAVASDGNLAFSLAGVSIPEGVTVTAQLKGGDEPSLLVDIDGATATAVGSAEGTPTTSKPITIDLAAISVVKYYKLSLDISATED